MHDTETITVRFKLSEEEWVAAHGWLLARNAAMRVSASLVALVLLLTALTFLLGGGLALGPILTYWPLLAVVPFLYYYLTRVVPRHYYRGDRRFRDGITYTFADDHFTCQSKFVESKVDWSLYTGVHEDEKMYVLIYGQGINMITPIPKRAFRSKRDERAFRSIVFPRFDKKLEGRIDEGDAPPEDDYSPPSLQPPDWR